MKKGEYFKINLVEELKQAYEMFEDGWFYSLETEIKDFNKGSRYVKCNYTGIFLGNNIPNNYIEIKSPVKNINNLNKLI